MGIGDITKDRLSKSKVDPCGVCSLKEKANSVLCVQYGKWIYSRYAGVKKVSPKFPRISACRKCERNNGEVME